MTVKTYDVTEEMLQRLYEGQVFKSFRDLCLQWNLLNNKGEPIGGNSKKQFMEELNRFVQIEKVGQKLIVKHIRTKDEILPERSEGGNIKYSKLIQQALVYHFWYMWKRWDELYKGHGGCLGFQILWCAKDMMYSCRIVNKHFTNYGRNGEMDEEEKENGSYADAFRRIVLPKFSSYIKAALNSMSKNKEIVLAKRTCFIKYSKEEGNKWIIPLTAEEKVEYLKIVDETLRSYRKAGGGVATLQAIFTSGKAADFYGTLRKKLKDKFGEDCRYIEEVYDITVEPGALEHAMCRLGKPETYSDELFTELNSKICEGLINMKTMEKEELTATRLRDYRESYRTNNTQIIDGEQVYWGDISALAKMKKEFYFGKIVLDGDKTKLLVDKMIRETEWQEQRCPRLEGKECYPEPAYYQVVRLYQDESQVQESAPWFY